MHDQYPRLDLSRPAFAPRSRLYHLEPLGIGTEHVESLTSYVARLAAAHAVSVTTLILHGISPRIPGSPASKTRYSDGCVLVPGRGSFFLNGSGHGAQDWVRVLGQITGTQNLRFLTALCWGGAVSGDEVVRRHRAWCPQCYQQWQDACQPAREPLLWAFWPVSVCALHRRPLETQCHQCGQTLHTLSARMRPGYCCHCQAWLGSSETASHSAPEANGEQTYGFWVSSEIGDFLRVAPSLSHMLSPETLCENLNVCRKRLARRGRTFAGIAEVSDSQMFGWFRKGYLVKLTSLMRISYRCGIPILDLLTCPPDAFQPDWLRIEENLNRTATNRRTPPSQCLTSPWDVHPLPLWKALEISGYKSITQLRRRNRQLHRELVIQHREARETIWKEKMRKDRAATLATAKAALESSLALDCPDVLHVTALRLDFETTSPLISRFPKLTAAIVAKRARWRRRQWLKKEAILREAVQQDMPPTVEALAASLGCNSRTPLRKRFPSLVAILTARYHERTDKQRILVQRTLEDVLQEDPPPSFQEIAHRVEWHIHGLRCAFPELSRRLRTRYRTWYEERSRQALLRLGREVQRAVSELHAQRLYPSYARVRPLLPTGVQGTDIEEMVRHAREQLGIPQYRSPISP